MNFETTEKIDFYLPKVKAFVEDHVIPVRKRNTRTRQTAGRKMAATSGIGTS